MSPQEPSAERGDAPQAASRKHVLVTGAGFTRALVSRAPLLVDDFYNDALEEKVRGLPNASRLLDRERSNHREGHIDIERLMTRLDALMPYDYADYAGNAANEYVFLLSELRRAFLDRLEEARQGDISREELNRFADYCATNSCCITFNYDDFLDEALARTYRWNPYWGYGFYCPSSLDAISGFDHASLGSGLLLLKLHGSLNWRPKLGYASPMALGSITHHHDWSGVSRQFAQIGSHLEREPVIVPPVLSKSGLVEQPVLRLVWSRAFTELATAHEVTFIGYSFPTTDIAVRTLFSEAMEDLPRENITIVNLASDESEADATRTAYRSALGHIPDEQFHFDGALKWIRRLPL